MQLGGVICLIICSVITVLVVVLRDILKVWDCFGAVHALPGKLPDRQLTTMSAGYAGNTVVPVTTQSNE